MVFGLGTVEHLGSLALVWGESTVDSAVEFLGWSIRLFDDQGVDRGR